MKLNYFNFTRFQDKVLLTNDLGGWIFLKPEEFRKLIRREVDLSSDLGNELLNRNFVFDETLLAFSSGAMYKLREAKNHLNVPTSLHIFVVTTACNMCCLYCQANSGQGKKLQYMTMDTAEKAVQIALQSPTSELTFEFQGGEPLLNFGVIRHIVEFAEQYKGEKNIQYTLVSNLTLLTDEIIEFIKTYHIGVSTSIDGNPQLHNLNRPCLDGAGSYELTVAGINRLKQAGIHPGAIETTTRYSLQHPKEIIDCYLELGFDSVFLRPLTPLGKADKSWDLLGYSPEQFVDFYSSAFDYLLEVNKSGRYLREEHASILMRKIDGQFVNYMDLRSPCGAGVGQLAYYADGNIFTCDEARMLYEMGQEDFLLGNVSALSYRDLICNASCRATCSASITESIPSCCDCVYQPYCGTCPVVSFALTGDILEKQPNGYRCRIYKGILEHIFLKLKENDNETVRVLDSWMN
jgi:His-Xaa-Ser system radical SAM maturase HxsB